MSIPSSATILLVGHNSCALDCILALANRGARHVTLLDDAVVDAHLVEKVSWLDSSDEGSSVVEVLQRRASASLTDGNAQCQIDLDTRAGHTCCQVNGHTDSKDPAEVLKSDTTFGKQFDIVITTDQPRSVEEAFGASQWDDKYLVISRNDGLNSKMRSQYRVHTVSDEDGQQIAGRDLHVHPEDVTPEKSQRVSQAMREAFQSTSSPSELELFLVLVAAAARVIESHPQQYSYGAPGSDALRGKESEVLAQAQKLAANTGVDSPIDIADVHLICERGWGAHPWTSKVFGEMIALEAAKLLSKTGRPINNAPIDLMARSFLDSKQHH